MTDQDPNQIREVNLTLPASQDAIESLELGMPYS